MNITIVAVTRKEGEKLAAQLDKAGFKCNHIVCAAVGADELLANYMAIMDSTHVILTEYIALKRTGYFYTGIAYTARKIILEMETPNNPFHKVEGFEYCAGRHAYFSSVVKLTHYLSQWK